MVSVSGVLVTNRVTILVDFGYFGHKQCVVFYSSLDMGMLLRRSHFFIIIEKEMDKSPSQLCLKYFTITAEIHARSLANFYCQYADRHMNLKFM